MTVDPGSKEAGKALGHDNPGQSKRFIDAAREAETYETEKGAEHAFKAVAVNSKRWSTK
ncbi:hypothetical protein V1282_003414 [Nitrobacteraceae bacterium AZCC 2146]|jgi:hypothetical protein